jgi:hypothetical protein
MIEGLSVIKLVGFKAVNCMRTVFCRGIKRFGRLYRLKPHASNGCHFVHHLSSGRSKSHEHVYTSLDWSVKGFEVDVKEIWQMVKFTPGVEIEERNCVLLV